MGDGILNSKSPGSDSGRIDKGLSMSQEGPLPEDPPESAARASGLDAGQQVGSILRTAYQSMIDEAIPDEMLNLLKRLD
jgi:Anti-sigma factor NepR